MGKFHDTYLPKDQIVPNFVQIHSSIFEVSRQLQSSLSDKQTILDCNSIEVENFNIIFKSWGMEVWAKIRPICEILQHK